jgi:hypothetical protein
MAGQNFTSKTNQHYNTQNTNIMKTLSKFTTLILLTLFSLGISAQNKFYVTTGGEMIFSFAPDIDNNGSAGNSVVRWTPWFNVQSYGNIDFSKNFGALVGMSIRNVGFIDESADPNNSGIKKKYRTYNFGIPVGIKLGVMNKFFLFGGYEIEFPFHYKEKTFVNNDKMDNKISGWFTGRTECCMHTVFAGVQLPMGVSLKFKYYLTNFFNEDFSEMVNGNINYPYAGKKANIMYISLSFALFNDTHINTYSSHSSSNNIY